MSAPRPKRAAATQKRLLMKCPYADCTDGIVKGMFGSRSDCATCNGLPGWWTLRPGEALPEREIIRQLLMRFEWQRLQIHELQRYQSELQKRLEMYERGR